MKHLFIVNPVAGKKKPEQKIKLIHDALENLPESSRSGMDYEIYVTREPLDACKKIREEAETGKELRVYACGGDGTLNECVNGAVGFENVAVTHFPCGTGNDFIKMFGDEQTRFSDLGELINGEIIPIDVIKCNDRYSVNICSMGVDAHVGTEVHKYSKLSGIAGYGVSLVANYVKGLSYPLTVRADGLVCGPRLTLVCVCNGRFYGGGFNPTNDARPDDGLMDVLVISGVNRLNFFKLIMSYATAKYKRFPQYITHLRTTHLEIEAEGEDVINVDGEAIKSHFTTFDLIPKGVNFLFPRGLKYFS